MTVEKKMSSGGADTKKMDMKTFIEMADAEKINADVENHRRSMERKLL